MYNEIIKKYKNDERLLAILLDPDKIEVCNISFLIKKVSQTKITHILVGGSQVAKGKTDEIVKELKHHTHLPIILFPGDHNQLTNEADGLLYLTLLSGNNPEYLIGQHIKAVPFLKDSNLEIISTGYILIDGGVATAVQQVSNTLPLPQTDINTIVNTALAGQFLGNKLIYLEAGSGARIAVSETIIKAVAKELNIPLIVGGGIRTPEAIEMAYQSGATMVVIGTAIEEDDSFLEKLKRP